MTARHGSANDPFRITLRGVAATAGITVVGVVAVGVVSLWRCGILGRGTVPGTLSEELCRTEQVTFWIVVLTPVIAGLAGTVRAAASCDGRLLRLPLAMAAAVPAGTALLYLISGAL